MMRTIRWSVVLAVLSLTGTAAAQGRVIVADVLGETGFDYRSLKDAVNAAQDGDAVLVRPGAYIVGTYQQVTIENKSVTLVADSRLRALPTFAPVIFIRNVPAGKSVTVRGLTYANLEIVNCAGNVWLDDCHQVNPAGYTNFPVKVQASRSVTLTDCSFRVDYEGGAVQVDASSVYAFRTEFRAIRPGPGADLVDTKNSGVPPLLVATGCSFFGSDALPGQPLASICYVPGVAGGDGVRILVGTAQLHDCVAKGGASAPANGPCPAYPGGKDVNVVGGSVVVTRAPARSLAANTAVREGQQLEIEVEGQSGDLAWLLFGGSTDPIVVPGCSGAVIPSLASLSILPLGVLGSQPLKLGVTVPPLAAASSFGSLNLQSIVISGSDCVLTPAKSVVLLDQRF